MVGCITDNPRLFLSRVDDSYRAGVDYVLGPWCFIGREEKFPTWEHISFQDAFENAVSKSIACDECSRLAASIIKILAVDLNQRHQRDYSFEYWWTLLIRPVLTTTQFLWRRWVTINSFIKKTHNEPLIVVVDPRTLDSEWKFKDTASLIYNGLQNEAFNYFILSLIIKALAPNTWTIVSTKNKLANISELPIPAVPFSTNFVKKYIKQKVGRLPLSDVPGIGGVSTLFFSCFINVLASKNREPERGLALKNFSQNYFPKEFLSLTSQACFSFLPRSFDSDFEINENKAKRYRYKAGRLYVSGAAHIIDENNYKVAHALIRGERVVRCQHGSDYGTMEFAHPESLYEYNNSAFLSWGWREHGKFPGNFIPAASPMLSKVYKRHRKKSRSIILVGTRTWVETPRIDQIPEPSYGIRYRQLKIKFVSSLNSTNKKHLVYRPYLRGKTDLQDEDYFQKYFPNTPILRSDLNTEIMRCSLLVLDHPGTTLNVAMAAEVPLICFWDRAAWVLTATARPYFEALEKANILFEKPEDAAEWINTVSNNLDDWWASNEVKEARKNWTMQFGLAKKTWWFDWLQILSKI